MNRFKLEDKIYCVESIPDNMKKIIIYCHGLGENKDRINQHDEILNKNNIGIISFDFPCHGEDKSDDIEFSLKSSIQYLNDVVTYSRKYNVPISLMGSSFGGYIILSKINKDSELFDKVFLKFPAVNFYECTKRKLKIDLDFFYKNSYYEFLNGKKLYESAFKEFMNDNLMNKFNGHGNDIYIIHGDKDRTVLLSDIEYFCLNNSITLKVIKGAEHGMKDYLGIVNDELIKFISSSCNIKRR